MSYSFQSVWTRSISSCYKAQAQQLYIGLVHWTWLGQCFGTLNPWNWRTTPVMGRIRRMDLIYILQICCLLLQPEKHANLRVRSPWLRLWSSMLHLFVQASDLGMILLGAMQFNMLKQSKEHGQPLQPATCCFSHCKFPQLWPPGLHSAVRKSRIYNKISSIQIPLSPSFGMFSIHLDSFDAKRALWMLWLHESKKHKNLPWSAKKLHVNKFDPSRFP